MPAVRFIGEKIKLQRVRLSYPDLLEPKPFKGEDNSRPRFSLTALLDPKLPPHLASLQHLKREKERAIKEARIPANRVEWSVSGRGEDRTDRNGQIVAGYEGMRWITAHSPERNPPLLMDPQGNPLTREQAQKLDLFYGGVFAHVTVNLYLTEKYPDRICCGIRAVKSLGVGERFGGGARDDEFDDFDEDDIGVGAPESGAEDNDGLG